MRQWQALLRRVVNTGNLRTDRTGVGTRSLFGESLAVDNSKSFPAVTTKYLAFKQVVGEMACFIRGNYSLDAFHSFGCSVWDGNGMAESWQPRAEFEGDLGRIYGVQWRDWRSVAHEIPAFGTPVGSIKRTDQLQELVDGIKRDPTGRRHIVTAWNPGELELMCLPPCPLLFQVYVNVDSLDMCVYQRSCDLFLGLPFDIAGYALLQRLIARKVGLSSGRLTFFIGDAHVYLNHMSQVNTVLERRPHSAPWLQLEADADLWDFQPHHAKLVCYEHHGAVPAPLNV